MDSGKLLPDEEQAACAARLSALADQLVDYTDSLAGYRRQLQAYQVPRHSLMQNHLTVLAAGWFRLHWHGAWCGCSEVGCQHPFSGKAEEEAGGAEGAG